MNPRNFLGENMLGKLEMIETPGGERPQKKSATRSNHRKHNEKAEKIAREMEEKQQREKERWEREQKAQKEVKEKKACSRIPKEKEKEKPIAEQEIEVLDELPEDLGSHESVEEAKLEQSEEEEKEISYEYEIEIRSNCVSETQRLAVEKELMSFANALRANDVLSSGSDNELEITWQGDIPQEVVTKTGGKFFLLMRKKLYEIAMKAKICLEVDYNSEVEPLGTSFVGIGEDDRESDYLLMELFQLLPRLSQRTARLSKRYNVSEDALKKAFSTLNSLANARTK